MNPRARKMIVSGVMAALLVLALVGGMVQAFSPQARADVKVAPTVTALPGLATDTERQVHWTARRGSSEVVALGADGTAKGVVKLEVKMADVQALAFAGGRLYVGDIGDAEATRPHVDVFRLSGFEYGKSYQVRRYRFVYPDGAHDAHAMAVSASGQVTLVTRGPKPGIYRSSESPASGGVPNSLTRVADAPVWATDATLDAEGRLVVRTLTSIHVLGAQSFEPVAAAALKPAQAGEALTTSLSGSGLVLGTLETPLQLMDVALPTSLAKVSPAPSAMPTPSASATPSAQPSSAAEKAESKDTGRSGTFWALGAAALLSLLAGGVVAVRK